LSVNGIVDDEVVLFTNATEEKSCKEWYRRSAAAAVQLI